MNSWNFYFIHHHTVPPNPVLVDHSKLEWYVGVPFAAWSISANQESLSSSDNRASSAALSWIVQKRIRRTYSFLYQSLRTCYIVKLIIYIFIIIVIIINIIIKHSLICTAALRYRIVKFCKSSPITAMLKSGIVL